MMTIAQKIEALYNDATDLEESKAWKTRKNADLFDAVIARHQGTIDELIAIETKNVGHEVRRGLEGKSPRRLLDRLEMACVKLGIEG